MQIAPQMPVSRVPAIQQFLLDHLLRIGLALERLVHIVMEYPHAGLLAAIEPRRRYPAIYLTWGQWLLRCQTALAFAGQLVALQLAELTLDTSLVDKRLAAVTGQRP